MTDSNDVVRRRSSLQARSPLQEALGSPTNKNNRASQLMNGNNSNASKLNSSTGTAGKRARSNSRSAGSTSTDPMEQFSIVAVADDSNENMTETVLMKQNILPKNGSPRSPDLSLVNTTPFKHTIRSSPVIENINMRERYTHIVVLKSLNGTFETKNLIIPPQPDVLKLGRPVVNNNQNNNSSGATDSRQAHNKKSNIRSDNGNFNSRVLSRNHAALTCDLNTGKIFIHDLKSSNGTFINGTRIGSKDVELRVGDVIDLGTDIDTKPEHRRISALVDNISAVPLVNETVDLLNSNNFFSEKRRDSIESNESGATIINSTLQSSGRTNFKDSQANSNYVSPENNYIPVPVLSSQRAAFEAAMFGDVNNIDLGNDILGTETEILSEIFINNSIGTSPNLINIMKMLSTEIALEKLENQKLRSIDNFLTNYTVNLDKIDKAIVEKNKAQLQSLQDTLKTRLFKKHLTVINNSVFQVDQLRIEKEKLHEQHDKLEIDQQEEFQSLLGQLEKLKKELEDPTTYEATTGGGPKDREVKPSGRIVSNSKNSHERSTKYTSESYEASSFKGGLILLASTAFVGFVAYALNLSAKPFK